MKKTIIILFVYIFCSFLNNIQSQWIEINNGMGYQSIQSLTVKDNIVFAGSEQHGVFMTTNNGSLWVQTSLNNVSVVSLIINGPNILAGTLFNGVYLSTNNGINWFQTSLTGLSVFSFSFNNNICFAGTGSGVYSSTNNGLNWTQTSLSNRVIQSLAVNGDNIYAGTANFGVYLSTNNGINWIQTSLNNQFVFSLSVDGNKVFAGTSVYGLYLSTNSGTTWSLTSLNNQTVRATIINGNNIFAGIDGPNSVCVSTDNGATWVPAVWGFAKAAADDLCIEDNYVFAGTNGAGIFRRPISELVNILSVSTEIPKVFSLSQNFPNPFNPSTKIKFDIPSQTSAKVAVYDMLGREVVVLVNEELKAGRYELNFDASKYASGVYFYKLETSQFTDVRKMLLVK